MTVRELLARVDSRELTEWMAYAELEPWGPEQEAWRAGTLAATFVNGNPWRKKSARALGPADFFPQLREGAARGRRQTAGQQKALLHALFQARAQRREGAFVRTEEW